MEKNSKKNSLSKLIVNHQTEENLQDNKQIENNNLNVPLTLQSIAISETERFLEIYHNLESSYPEERILSICSNHKAVNKIIIKYFLLSN